MKKILLIESDYVIMDKLYHIILKYKRNVSIFQTGVLADAYQTVLSHDIELIIADTALNKEPLIDISCLRFIEDIRQFDKYAFVPVIVISPMADECLHVFRELHCYGYLEKPFSYETAEVLIKDALRFKMQKREKRFVYFKNGCVFHPIRVSEIIYIEHKRRQMLIHTREGIVDIPYHTCSDTMQQLIDEDFVPCSRGTIVNMDFIQSLDGINQYLILREGLGQLEVGRSYVKKIKDALQDM